MMARELRYLPWPLSEGYVEALLSNQIESYPLYADEV